EKMLHPFVETRDEVEDFSHVGEVHVGAWFVGFRLEREARRARAVFLERIMTDRIETIDQTLERIASVLAEDEIESFAPVPEHHDTRAELDGGIDGARGVGKAELANGGIVRGHRAVPESRVGEERRRVHAALESA